MLARLLLVLTLAVAGASAGHAQVPDARAPDAQARDARAPDAQAPDARAPVLEAAPDARPTSPPASTPVRESIIAGMSQAFVDIDATFVGSEILIFGAISREAAPPPGRLGVIVVVEGPKQPVTVRRKERRFGIWVNTDAADFQAVPSFYAVATSAPLGEILLPESDARREISIETSMDVWGVDEGLDAQDFKDALIRIRSDNALFWRGDGAVRVVRQTLFDTAVELPANLTEGYYKTRIFLTRDGEVVSSHISLVRVEKVGLERWLYTLAQEQALLYALLSLAIAIAAGWLASAAFRFVSSN